MMPDKDLLNAIDRMAATRQATGDAIGYYLDEHDRRQQRKLNQRVVRLTRWVVILTIAVLILTALSTYTAFH
jgi:hypothetical protein